MKKWRKKSNPVSPMTPKLALLKLLKNDAACRSARWSMGARCEPIDITSVQDSYRRFMSGDTTYTFNVEFVIPAGVKIKW